MMLLIGYEYESAMGKVIRKAVVCKTEDEYKRVKRKIEAHNLTLITFDEVFDSEYVPK